jgi:hypothetical protein
LLQDRIEDIVNDIKNGKLGCVNCTVSKGKERERAPVAMPIVEKQILKAEKPTPKAVTKAVVPTYRAVMSNFGMNREPNYTNVMKVGNQDGFTVKVGKARRKTVTKKAEIVQKDVTPERERHLKIRFVGPRGVRHVLPGGIITESILSKLNETICGLNIDAYFSKAGTNKWGDVEMTLARTRAVDLANARKAMEDALNEIEFKDFTFVRDTKKIKLYLAMVPLMRGGYGTEWKPEDWHCEDAFDGLATDIEHCNPGTFVCARPSWVGKLHTMKARKQTTAGLIVLCEMNDFIKGTLARTEPKMLVGGRKRFCRV